MTQDITVRIGLEGAAQVQTGLQGVGRSAETVGQALGRLGPASQALANNMGMVGISAGQATNAMRQLPAQITDIVTGLASGQAPLTVLIQQGGQLRDSFGSVGNVLRGLASVVRPATVALGAVAGAVGAIGAAFKAGADEAAEYRKALVLTGNAAGASVGQLQQAAVAVSNIVGTQGKAADAVAQLAASGRVAAADIGKLAEAAIRLEREGGPAIKDTVKAFADLGGKDPTGAVEKLNESTNFLTLSLYKQISALQERGKADEAAKLAQDGYATSVIARSKELESKLGTLETVWRKVSDAAKGAWDAMLNMGRPQSPEKELEDVTRRIDALTKGNTRTPNAFAREKLAQLQADAEALRAIVYANIEAGQAEADRQRLLDAGIDKEKKAVEARKKAAEELQRLIEKGRDLVRGNDLEKAGFSPGFLKDMQALQAYAKAAGLSTAQLQSAIGDLIEKQPFAERAAKLEAEAHKAVVEAMGKEMEARQKHLDALTKDIEAQDKANEKLGDELVRLRDGEAALEARIELRQRELVATLELQAVQALLERGDAAEYERIRQRASALETEIELRRQISGAKAANDARDAAAKDAEAAARAWERTADNIRESLTDAFRRAFESGEDFGTAMAKVIENELKARIATALAGLLAEGVMSLAGIDGGSGGGNKATASSVIGGANLATNVARLYGAGGSGAGSLLASANYANVYGGTAYGTAYGSQQSAMLASQEAGMVNASTASYASWAGYAALAIMAAIQGSADYSRGFRREQSRDSGTALGDASYRTADLFSRLGVSDRIADLISGATLTARLFGRAAPQVVGQGVLGTFGGGGQAYSVGYADIQERGGVFRGDKNYTAYSNLPGDRAMFGLRELPQEISRFLSDASASMYAEAKRFGDVLGLPAEQLATVASDFRIALTDDVEANKQAIADAIGAYGDALVQSWSAAVAPLAQYGETVAQTIQRVGAALSDVNAVIQSLGGTALASSIDGAKAALSFEGLFGGIQGLQQSAGTFLQQFYSDSERTDLALRAIGDTLADVGLQVPATRDAFRALVGAQDLTSESGRQAAAALLAVAGAFADVVPAARSAADILDERRGLEDQLLRLQGDTAELRRRERATLDESNRALYDQIKALEDQMDAADAAAQAAQDAADAMAQLAGSFDMLRGGLLGDVSSAYQTVAGTIAAERARIEGDADRQIAALEQRAERIKSAYGSVLDGLDDVLRKLRNDIAGDSGRGAGAATLQQVLVDARRGRSVDINAARQAAAEAANVDGGNFATRTDYVRALAQTSQLVRDVGAVIRRQRSDELRNVARAQVGVEAERDRQLAALDNQLQAARDAAATLVSIDDGVQTVADAINRLGDAIGAAQAGLGFGPTNQLLRSGTADVWRSGGGAVAIRPAGGGADQTLIRGITGNTFAAAQAQAWVGERWAAGDVTGIVARAILEGIDSTSLDRLMGVPDGTSLSEARKRGLPAFAAGSAFVPATGLALVHQGERIVPAADNAALMRAMTGGGSAADVVAELRALRDMVMRNDAAIAAHVRKTAELMDDVVNGGASVATRAEA